MKSECVVRRREQARLAETWARAGKVSREVALLGFVFYFLL